MPPEKTVHPWLAHLGGLTAIRKARYKKACRSYSEIGIFATLDNSPDKSTRITTYDTSIDEWFINNSTHNQRLLDSIFFTLHGSDPPPLTEKRPTDDPFNDLVLRTQTILQPEPSLFETDCPRARERIEKLLVAARSQLLSFREWPLRMPECWHPTRIQIADLEGTDLSQVDIYPSRIDVYPSCKSHLIYFSSQITTDRDVSVHRRSLEHLPHNTIATMRSDSPMRPISGDSSPAISRHIRIPGSMRRGAKGSRRHLLLSRLPHQQ